jgi:integrase/recombinase XerD
MNTQHQLPPHSGEANIGHYYTAYEDGAVLTMFLAGRKQATRRKYEGDLQRFVLWLEGRSLSAVTLQDLQLWANSLTGAPKTVRERISTVRSFFSFAFKLGYLRFNPAELLKLPTVKDGLHERILSEQEWKALRAATCSERDYALVDFLSQSGVRVSELCALQWKDVREGEDGGVLVNIWRQKSEKATVQKYGAGSRIASLFKKLREGRKDEDYVFYSYGVPATIKERAGQNTYGRLDSSAVYRIVRAAAKRAGIEKPVSPHWLRHSCATRLASRVKDVAKVAEWLGHSSIASTMRYVHIVEAPDLSEHVED